MSQIFLKNILLFPSNMVYYKHNFKKIREVNIMSKFLVSEEAYKEFKAFLEENEVENYSIRINLAGFGCSGPAFNITVDEAKEGDISEKINDITLIAEEKLVDEFGGFRLLSSEENGGRGLSLKPVIEVEGGCGSCGGGCHH